MKLMEILEPAETHVRFSQLLQNRLEQIEKKIN